MEYTKFQKQILDRLENFVQEQGSQTKASKILGFSTSTISTLRKGTYDGNVDVVINKLAEYFGIKEEQLKAYSEIEYADTSISHEIYSIIRVCQVKGGFAIACGDAGIGKTKAIKQYLKDNPNNSILITINPCFTSVKSVLSKLALSIGAVPEKSKDALWLSVANRLRDGMVLIFDEAQHLTLQTIEVLRSFSDYFADKGQTLGIIFIGNIETIGRVGNKKAEYSQIVNRTKQTKIYSVNEIKREDIQKLFPIIANEDMEIDFLWRLSKIPQIALRGVVNLFSNAYDNENYTYAGLVAMAEFMDMNF